MVQGDGAGFRLLFVCTGNLCRSPLAELLTRHLMTQDLDMAGLQVASAGVRAVVGSGIDPDARRELAAHGVLGAAVDTFIARQLEPGMIAEADLVLGAAPEHRASVLQLWPRALPKAFTISEFARLASAVDPADLPLDPTERAHALVAQARGRRGLDGPRSPRDDAIIDPIGRGRRAHREAAGLIHDSVAVLVDRIGKP